MQRDLTRGSVLKTMLLFSLPYLLSTFLQTLYGLADLFIAGQFNGADVISAVSIGSQVMHFVTVVIVGLAMGSTVLISRSVGAKDKAQTGRAIGSTIIVFMAVAAIATAALLLLTGRVVSAMSTPPEAVSQTRLYLMICFAGIPAITAYNIISAIFRGLGDTRSPMIFVAVACVINILLDVLLIGVLRMQAVGAALGTVISQACSVIFALMAIRRRRADFPLTRQDLIPSRAVTGQMLRIGVPVACQDAFIQVSFLLITVIANQRGVHVAAAVGVVEKIIGIMFLVPSAMLSTVSALAAQNMGASRHDRARQVLFIGIGITALVGTCFSVWAQFGAEWLVDIFSGGEAEVTRLGGQYLRAYVFDCIFAGAHFCFSGYFCAYGKSWVSFAHNVASIVLCRIPVAYFAAQHWPETLYPMGWAAPLGSVLSALICAGVYAWMRRKRQP